MVKELATTLLIIAFIFLSCQRGNDPGNPNNSTNTVKQLLPLKVGNNWTYTTKEFNENGTVKSNTSGKQIITGTDKKNNKTYFVLTEESFLNDTLLLIRSDENNVYLYIEDGNTEWVYYKWPATNGEILYSSVDGSYKEEGIASTTPVTINTFEGFKVFHNILFNNQPYSNTEIYFKPQLGIIGAIDYNRKNSGPGLYKQYESQLVSYDLK